MRSPLLCTEICFSRLQHCFLFLIVLSVVFGASTRSVAQGNWPMPGHDAQRTSRANYAGPTSAPSSPSWIFSSLGPVVGDIVTSAEGKLYFISDKLYVLNPDGTPFAPAAAIGIAATGPVVDDNMGLVYVAVSAADGGFDLMSFNKLLQNGMVALHVPKPPFGGGISPLLLGDGAVYFVAGRFPGVAYAAGAVQWSNPVCPSESGPNTPFGVSANGPALSADGSSLFIMCAATVSAAGGLFRLNAFTGEVIASVSSDRNSTEPALDSLQHVRSGWQAFGGAVFCGDYLTWDFSLTLLSPPSRLCDSTRFTTSRAAILPDGRSTVRIGFSFPPNNQLDAEGANNWIISTDNSTVPNFSSLPSVDAAGNIFIGNTQGIQARNALDGHVLWSFTTGDAITTQPVLANGGALYVGSSSGKVYAFNASPTLNSGTVYLTGAGGGFATVDLRSATVAAKNGFTDSGAISVSPDGSRSYVSGIFGLNVVDNATNQVIATVPVGARPAWNAISPDGSRVYVTQPSSSEVFVVDTATNSILASILLAGPQRVAVAPDNSRVYVGSNGRGIAVIDPVTNTISHLIDILGSNTTGITFTPDSAHAYVGEIGGAGLYLIDARTDTFLQSISLPALGGGIGAVVASPDGKKIYAANVRTSPVDPAHNVFVLDPSTNSTIGQIPVSFPASQMAITSDGANVLVGDNDIGELVVASMATDSVVETIRVNDPCCPVISGIGTRPPATLIEAPSLTVPLFIDFGATVIGSETVIRATVTNSGKVTATINSIASSDPEFISAGPITPVTIPIGQSITATLIFRPTARGSHTAEINLGLLGAPTIHIPVAGLGLLPATLMVNPSVLQFDPVTIGQSQTLSLGFTNLGDVPLTIQNIVLGDSAFTSGSQVGTIQANATATINVFFAPLQLKPYSTTLTISSDAVNPTGLINLRGAGKLIRKAPFDDIVCNSVESAGRADGKAKADSQNGSFSLNVRSHQTGTVIGEAGNGFIVVPQFTGNLKITAFVTIQHPSEHIVALAGLPFIDIQSATLASDIFVRDNLTHLGLTTFDSALLTGGDLLGVPALKFDIKRFSSPELLSVSASIPVSAATSRAVCAGVVSKAITTGVFDAFAASQAFYTGTVNEVELVPADK